MKPRLAGILSMLFAALAGAPVLAAGLSESERAGKRIYVRGESPRGAPISALLGDPPMRIAASVLPCASCHGEDGRGRPEGGVIPSELAWSSLARSYGSTHPTGRRHRPYDEEAFARALRDGLDPSGNRLGAAMVRYELSDEDMRDLIAYLKAIDRDVDPGIDDGTIRIATVIPADGPFAALGEGVRRVLEARFAERNAAGGIFSRTLILEAIRVPADREAALAALESHLAVSEPFLLVAPFVPDLEAELRALAERREIPLIAPAGHSPDGSGAGRAVFHLAPSLEDQARALADHALVGLGEAARLWCVLPAADAADERLATELLERGRRAGLAADRLRLVREGDEADVSGADRVLFLGGGGAAAAWLARAEARGALPERLALLGARIDDALFEAPPGATIHAAFPIAGTAQSPEARAAHLGLLEKVEIARPAWQFTNADAAATLICSALETSGRELRRSGLIRSLEGVYRLELGLLPPITFGPSRRNGTRGASIVRVDLAARTLISVVPWQEVSR